MAEVSRLQLQPRAGHVAELVRVRIAGGFGLPESNDFSYMAIYLCRECFVISVGRETLQEFTNSLSLAQGALRPCSGYATVP